METLHKIIYTDARTMGELPSESVDLVVTSPPYPMIQMWDELFSRLSSDVHIALKNGDGNTAFEAMHLELDKVWKEVFRVLKPGAIACINIGDATRTVSGSFQLYPNHARITSSFRTIGFDTLPLILWRKQTNAPNKFMGSGMLPAGAYVTLEHEYILIFRKFGKREFKSDLSKKARKVSSFFWEERNRWFSDVWDFKGTDQQLKSPDLRNRSAAFPLELPYRLINMYSLYGDLVLDPFMGTGTTALASIACGRNSIGIEIDKAFSPLLVQQELGFMPVANKLLFSRIKAHEQFSDDRIKSKGIMKHVNANYGFPVMTKQEIDINLYRVSCIRMVDDTHISVLYETVDTLCREQGFTKLPDSNRDAELHIPLHI